MTRKEVHREIISLAHSIRSSYQSLFLHTTRAAAAAAAGVAPHRRTCHTYLYYTHLLRLTERCCCCCCCSCRSGERTRRCTLSFSEGKLSRWLDPPQRYHFTAAHARCISSAVSEASAYIYIHRIEVAVYSSNSFARTTGCAHQDTSFGLDDPRARLRNISELLRCIYLYYLYMGVTYTDTDCVYIAYSVGGERARVKVASSGMRVCKKEKILELTRWGG